MTIETDIKQRLLTFVREELERGQHRTTLEELAQIVGANIGDVFLTLTSELSRTERERRKSLPPKSTFILVEYALIKLSDTNLPINMVNLVSGSGLNNKTIRRYLSRRNPPLELTKKEKKKKPPAKPKKEKKVKPPRVSRISPRSIEIANFVREDLKQFAMGEIPDIPTGAETAKKFGNISRERVRQILGREFTCEELALKKRFQNKSKKPYYLQHLRREVVLFLVRQEVIDFWQGKVDHISTVEELAIKYNIAVITVIRLLKCLTPYEKTQRYSLTRIQVWGNLPILRKTVNLVREELSLFEQEKTDHVSKVESLAKQFNMSKATIRKWLNTFLTNAELLKLEKYRRHRPAP